MISVLSKLRFSCFLLALSIFVGCSKPPNDKYAGRCELKMENSTEVRGFRLGSTIEQLKGRFPALNIPLADERGHTYLYIENSENASPNYILKDNWGKVVSPNVSSNPTNFDLNGVEKISLSFLDNRLMQILVQYKYSGLTRTEFESKISEVLLLPAFYGSDVECWDFRVSESFFEGIPNMGPWLTLKDVAADNLWRERLNANPEKGSPARREIEEKEKEKRESEQRKEGFKP
jgi:hypothetical protein